MRLSRQAQGGPWLARTGNMTPLCAELQFFPPAVLAAWSIPTSGPPCRKHHRAKQVPGWHLAQGPPGHMTWRLPSGPYQTTGDPYLG